MSFANLARRLTRLEAAFHAQDEFDQIVLDAVRAKPACIMREGGIPPDPWQQRVLGSKAPRMLLLASRQSGKSSVAAALALHTALSRSQALVLLLSPSLRQSSELFRKVSELFHALGRPLAVIADSTLKLELANGSRVVSLPGDERNIRGFSGVSLLVIDEAARVADELYYAVRPMLAVSQGRLVALSTPFGKRGWFHDAWIGAGDWERINITAKECHRISPAFLAEERSAIGERWYRQEYECSFEDSSDAVFAWQDIQAALADDVEPLFSEASPSRAPDSRARRYFIGLDLGQTNDFSALAVLERPLVAENAPVAARRPPYQLRYLQRFPRGTSYPAVVQEVLALLRQAPLPGETLVVDQTGVGRPVVDMFVDALQNQNLCHLWPITITGGHSVTMGTTSGTRVPKCELVGTMQVLLQSHRLRMASRLAETPLLVRELENFGVDVTSSRHEVFQARSGHDDLLMAVALAAWVGEKTLPSLADEPEEAECTRLVTD